MLFHEIYSRLAGCNVDVVTDPREDRVATGENTRIHEHPLGSRDWGIGHFSGLRQHLRTAGVIRRLAVSRSTIVHCGRPLPEGFAAWLVSYQRGLRYLCWAHGEDLVTARQSREFAVLTTWILRRARFCVANSCNTAALIASFGVPRERIKVVYPGVDTSRFSPSIEGGSVRTRLGFSADDVVMLSVGRLQRRKGHDLVLLALSRLCQRLPRMRYVIVGDGEERDALIDRIRRLGLGDLVRMVGSVAEADLPAYYAASDLFVLPNRVEEGDIEGFGIVFLEAASSARPAIGGNSGGVPEAIVNGSTGLLVSGTDAEELAAAIAQIAENRKLQQKLGSAGRERVLREFTWERASSAVSDLNLEAAFGTEP